MALGIISSAVAASASTHADSTRQSTALTPAEARGKIIYTTGRTSSGRTLSFRLLSAGDGTMPANGIHCAGCHGTDGKGAREGNIVMADIRDATLTRPLSASPPRYRTRIPYTDALLIRAITQGVDASGNRLEAAMPRWVIDAADLKDL